MAISLGTNISSLRAQRNLARQLDDQSRIFGRLASGRRIERASDDAAGLAIAESLRAGIRVYNQGIRNLGDGISALNIAQGSIDQVTGIITRLKELSEQAANGVFSRTQRLTLNKEADALVDEYTRLLSTTKFNGLSLFDPNQLRLSLQAGFGSNANLSLDTGSSILRTTGTATYNSSTTIGTAGGLVQAADFRNLGRKDLYWANFSGGISVKLQNADGSYGSEINYGTAGGSQTAKAVDMNGDGILDLVGASTTQNSIIVRRGNGDGTFAAGTSYAFSGTTNAVFDVGDLNCDGLPDVVVSTSTGVQVLRNNGSGGLVASQAISIPGTTQNDLSYLKIVDLDGDGKKDVVVSQFSGPGSILYGDGTG